MNTLVSAKILKFKLVKYSQVNVFQVYSGLLLFQQKNSYMQRNALNFVFKQE